MLAKCGAPRSRRRKNGWAAGGPFPNEPDALVGAAPGGGLLLGRVQHAAYALPAAGEVDVQHGVRLPLAHRVRRHVAVETPLLGRALLVDVPLSHVVQGIAAVPQQAREGGDLRRQAAAPRRRDVGVDHHAVVVGIQPGEQGRPRRRAHRGRGVGGIEGGTLRCQAVEVGSLADRVPVAPQRVLPELVGHEQDDVGPLGNHVPTPGITCGSSMVVFTAPHYPYCELQPTLGWRATCTDRPHRAVEAHAHDQVPGEVR